MIEVTSMIFSPQRTEGTEEKLSAALAQTLFNPLVYRNGIPSHRPDPNTGAVGELSCPDQPVDITTLVARPAFHF